MKITICILCGIILVKDFVHYRERKDLYNRIMSKDLTEYKERKKEIKHHISAHKRVLKNWRKVG